MPLLFGNTAASGGGLILTGGTSVTSGGYIYKVFSSVGTSSFTVAGSGIIEYVVVGGGGGTATNRSGGGGGGGLLQSTLSVVDGTYNVFVGNKGTQAIINTGKRQSSGGFSGIGNSSSGYRYWKFVGGAGIYGSHFPNSSRIGFTTESGDVDFIVYNSDNCGDIGKIPALSAPTDTYIYDFGSAKTVTGLYLYSVYSGGYRIGSAKLYGSNDNSTWTFIDEIPVDNATACGLLRFNVSAPASTLLVAARGGGASGATQITWGSGGGAGQGETAGTGTAGQGNNGGNGNGTGSGGSGAGGGGGGYSSAGSSAPGSTTGGNGGQGWSITSGWSGLSVFSGMTVLSSGGGGASPFGTPGTGGTGAGNGGYGTSDNSVGKGTNATSYGSGGGGGAYGGGYANGTGSDGYQGIVIVRVPVA